MSTDRVTVHHMAEIFRNAYHQVATMHHALKAFKGSGIWPVNRHVFKDEDFLAVENLCNRQDEQEINLQESIDLNDFSLEVNINLKNENAVDENSLQVGTYLPKEMHLPTLVTY